MPLGSAAGMTVAEFSTTVPNSGWLQRPEAGDGTHDVLSVLPSPWHLAPGLDQDRSMSRPDSRWRAMSCSTGWLRPFSSASPSSRRSAPWRVWIAVLGGWYAYRAARGSTAAWAGWLVIVGFEIFVQAIAVPPMYDGAFHALPGHGARGARCGVRHRPALESAASVGLGDDHALGADEGQVLYETPARFG